MCNQLKIMIFINDGYVLENIKEYVDRLFNETTLEVTINHHKLFFQLSLILTEEELLVKIKKIMHEYPDLWIFAQLSLENYDFAVIHKPDYLKQLEDDQYWSISYYNDFDDYEDEIEFATLQWVQSIAYCYIHEKEIKDLLSLM